jgi:hypothetical protein
VQLNTIPRTAVKATLLGLRLPICGVEALTGQTGNASWPPAIAFEGFEAGVKQVVGSILRDEELVDEGRIQQAKVTELRRAVELEVQADQTRAAGARELRERRARAKEERTKAAQDALRREQMIERDKRAAEQRVERELAEKAAAIEATAERRDKRVAAVERDASLTRVEQESAAVARQRRAVQATKAANNAGDALERKKAQRQAKK